MRAVAVALLFSPLLALAQAEPSVIMTPRSSFTFSVDYAPTSNYLFLGVDRQRALAQVQLGYRRKLVGNAYAQWSWEVDAQPFILMTEPIAKQSVSLAGGPDFGASARVQYCTPGTTTQTSNTPTGPVTYTITTACGRITDYGYGAEPLGQHIRFLPFSRIGPFIEANAGFLVFNRNIPSDEGRRFNFQFDGGAGLEYALPHRRWVAVEYRVHHISNAYTAPDNSGIDQQMIRLSYIFGR